MSELPRSWSTYARLQQKLTRKYRVDSEAWGLEAGLNSLVDREALPDEDVERLVRSASRRTRYQNRLRRIYLVPNNPIGNGEDALDAIRKLRFLIRRIGVGDRAILVGVGEGYTYKELAAATGVSPGALRARVLRLRRTLVA
jgi:DNA-directed RNA polymerase specialized sigma24 family protein